MRILRFTMLALIGVGLGVACSKAIVMAASANLSDSYKSTSNITAGSLVSLDPQHSGYVITANDKNSNSLLGVAVASNDSLLAVNTIPGDVQVAISGLVDTLVSTLNGSINIGDQITASPINGVGMKATAGSEVVGTSQTTFTPNSPGASQRQIIDKSGNTQQIAVGYIPLVVAVGTSAKLSGSSGGPTNPLQSLFSSVAGHSVSNLTVATSTAIAFVAIISVISLVYGTIRGSIISIGRNPLAKPAIFESLAQVIGMASLIVVIAVTIIYFVLR